MNVIPYHDGLQQAWDAFVLQQEDGTLFCLTAWQRAVAQAFGYEPRYLCTEEQGTITGVLPLFLVSNPIVGKTLLSSPFAVYGGVCAADAHAHRALTSAACDMARQEAVDYLELRVQAPIPEEGFHTKNLYVTFEQELLADTEKMFKQVPHDTRYMIRKGTKKGLRIETGNHQLGAFYEIYARSVRHLGTPVFAKRFFEILQNEFREAVEIMVAWKDSVAVAGVLSFRFRDWILPYYAGSTLDGRALAANNFLFWEVMKNAAERGIKYYDFGRSKLGTGSYAFKSTWGMRERPLPYQFYLVKRSNLPNFSPANPKFRAAIQLWKRLPLPLTKVIGPPLVRLFP